MHGGLYEAQEPCHLCNRTAAETLHAIVLYGRPYDSKRLWDATMLEYAGPRVSHDDNDAAVALDVGVSCLDKATVFHSCYHFKMRVFQAIEKGSKKLTKQDKSLKVCSRCCCLRLLPPRCCCC